jgi:4-amino-4-deoxy-L-arabinose transferase-like glycosyltransferase
MQKLNRRTYLLGGLFVLALTAFFALANWHWLRANVVTYGWDRLDHLITSFVYRDTLSQVTPRSLLAALAYSDYYPPLVHYGAVVLYRLFGVDEDVAPMVNVFYMAILLGAAFWIAGRWRLQQLAGTAAGAATGAAAFWTGALAAALLGLFPIIFAMSRYLYLDFALTALVALDMALLIGSERFARRWPALGVGLVLGLALWVKWTAAAFLIGPLIYMVLRAGVLPYAWRHPRALLPCWRWLILALAAGVAVIGLWFWLAQDVVAALPLGWSLVPLLGLLLGGVFYTLFVPAGAQASPTLASDSPAVLHEEEQARTPALRLRNVVGAGVVAAFVIALWYLTNIEFLNYFLFTAYGREDEPFYAFGKYLGEVINEQLGPWFALVFVVVVVVWAWQAWRRRQRGVEHVHRGLAPVPGAADEPHVDVQATQENWLRLSDIGWVLLLWVVVPYFVFSFRVTLAHSRFVMPFLPPFAVWMAVGLMQWRPPVLRWSAVAIVLLLGISQFALISFDELAAWRTPLRVEIAGDPVNFLANGFFIQYPASGVTDPGYAVAPDVLAYVDRQRQEGGTLAGRDVVNLGLLVNSYQVHEKHFLYSIYKDFPHVRLRELARNWSQQPAYNQLFEMDYVLVSDTHTFRTNENSQAAVQRILYDPADAFNQAFAPVRQWTLPSGEQLTLYGRRFAALEPGVAPSDYQQLLKFFGDRLGPGDAVVLVSPDQVYMLGLSLPANAGAAVVPLPVPGESELQTVSRLQDLAGKYGRIFLLSHNAEQVDPTGSIEVWLRANAVAANDEWAGSVRVTPFMTAGGNDTEGGTAAPLDTAAWENGPALTLASVQSGGQAITPTAGGGLVMTVRWADDEAALQAGNTLKASLQLLAADGTLMAQEDREVTLGEQKFVLMIPRSAAPGDYKLGLVVYDASTGQRYRVSGGGDVAQLGTVTVGLAPVREPVELPPLRHPDDAEDEGS